MDLKIYLNIIDFGLVVLIFLVQLCIYPAFKYFNKEGLKIWHRIYTPNITYVVLPLMLSQLSLSGYFAFFEASLLNAVHFGLVALTWISTFVYFVPLHQKINAEKYNATDLHNIEKTNWLRLVLWTLIFIIGLLNTNLFYHLVI